jgi:hypothetical protein
VIADTQKIFSALIIVCAIFAQMHDRVQQSIMQYGNNTCNLNRSLEGTHNDKSFSVYECDAFGFPHDQLRTPYINRKWINVRCSLCYRLSNQLRTSIRTLRISEAPGTLHSSSVFHWVRVSEFYLNYFPWKMCEIF